MLMIYRPGIVFPFDWNKGIAMLRYLLHNVGDSCNLLSLVKLAFFSDRFHVRNHARPVSMDVYYAFPFGPGGSNIMNIIRMPEVVSESESGIKIISNTKIGLKNKSINQTLFSKSDIIAMDKAIEIFVPYIKKNDFILSEISHAYPEWAQYEKLFEEKRIRRGDVSYADFLKNVDENHPLLQKYKFINPYPPLTPEEQNDLEKEMIEYSSQLI